MKPKKTVQWVDAAAKASTAKARVRAKNLALRKKAQVAQQTSAPHTPTKDIAPHVPQKDFDSYYAKYEKFFKTGHLFVTSGDMFVSPFWATYIAQKCETLEAAISWPQHLVHNVIPAGSTVVFVGTARETERLRRDGGTIEAMKLMFLVGGKIYYIDRLDQIVPT